MMNNIKKKILINLLIAVAIVLSMTLITNYVTNPKNHVKTMQALDDKKEDVLKLSAASAAASTALASIPGDSTTPVANKLADLTSYFMIILMVIFFEKYLITVIGYASFFILIPIACFLLVLGIDLNKAFFKVLAGKIAVFGLVIYLVIPVSLKISAIIEKTYDTSIESVVTEAEDITEEIDESDDSNKNIVEKALSKLDESISGLVEKGEKNLNHFMETVAVMVVTSCLIPIAVLAFALWFVKILFGVQISEPKDIHKKIPFKIFGHKEISE